MSAVIQAVRYHDISCGHRVYKHESKCKHLHGHNYRIHFYAEAEQLDQVGRVIDFSKMKSLLCEWLEQNLDHRFLVWEEDPIADTLTEIDPTVVKVPFNPTAENIAGWIANVICPELLKGTNITVTRVDVDETRKCSVSYFADLNKGVETGEH